ncbi:hypothetical protein Tco_0608367 [Tanacetum coccineum]
MAPRTRTTISLVLWEQLTKGNERCRWASLREKFVKRFALRRRCHKDPTEVSKIVRRANETLPNFKERWTEEMGYIQGVPEVMQISAFMTNSKCPKLARRFADQVPQTVTEMMKRGGGPPKYDGYNDYNRRVHYQPYASPRQQGQRYENRRFKNQRQEVNQLSLESLVKRPKEILATELQLQLPPPPPLVGTQRKENLDRYYDYHGEKGHYTNNCLQSKRQLEVALESGKLNHLVKDVRQREETEESRSGITTPKDYDGVHGGTSVIPIQHYPRTDMNKRTLCCLIHHSCNDEVSHPKGNCHTGPSERCNLLVLAIRRQADSPVEPPRKETVEKEESPTQDIMINPTFPDQIVTIGTQFSMACRLQMINLLKDNKDMFSWQPSDMIGVPRRISQHSLSVNPSITPVAQNQRVLGLEKSKAVIKEVEEWIKAGIVRPVWYPTWISNPVLVKKLYGTCNTLVSEYAAEC